MENGELQGGGAVQSVDRAMRLLELLSGATSGIRLTQIARNAGLSPSTAHRLLTTLESRRFAQYDPLKRTWHVGQTAFSVGQGFVHRHAYSAAALPILRRLRNETRETANLGACIDGDLFVLEQVPSREIEKSLCGVGGRLPLQFSGMGKALLAAFAKDQSNSDGALRPRLSASALAQISEYGFAVDNGEINPDLRCVASVVYDHRSEPCCAISISGAAHRVSDARIEQLGAIVRDAASELTSIISRH